MLENVINFLIQANHAVDASVFGNLLGPLAAASLQHNKDEAIARFAMLYRGMLICSMLGEDPEMTYDLLQQGKDIVQLSDQVRMVLIIRIICLVPTRGNLVAHDNVLQY